MSGTRPSIFDEDIDLSGFKPKAEPETPPVPPETVRRVSEEGGFPSRAPFIRKPTSLSASAGSFSAHPDRQSPKRNPPPDSSPEASRH